MSDWADALRNHANKVSNTYSDYGMAYDIHNAAIHVEQLEAENARLKARVNSYQPNLDGAAEMIRERDEENARLKAEHFELVRGFQKAADATNYAGDWFEAEPINRLIAENARLKAENALLVPVFDSAKEVIAEIDRQSIDIIGTRWTNFTRSVSRAGDQADE